jgi:ATP-binding cassette subfamily F protein 3
MRNILGCFLFSEDDVYKRIGVLSGGERNRYALARMLMHPSNFLLLDEPTNHLDIRAKDVLLAALEEFTGTVVFVSHDRYFIDKLATRVFEVADGGVNVFPGNYEDYRWRKEQQALQATDDEDKRAAPRVPTLVDVPRREEEEEKKSKRINPIRLKQMESRLAEVEEDIARTEADIAATEQALANFVSAQETQRQTASLADLKTRLESLMSEWEELSTSIEANA